MQLDLPSGTPAELRTPADGREPTQGLVIIPDVGGLRPLFFDMAQRLADEQGWAVCTFEPWPGREHMTLEERFAEMHSLTDERLVGDAVASAERCDVAPVGVIGFCMGGTYTFKAAANGRFHRAVAFYGLIRPPENWNSEGQAQPLDVLRSPERCPTLAIIGTADQYTPPADVDDLEATGVTVARYDGAEHGFVHDPSRPAHRPDDAADAWQRALTFLRS